MRKVAVPFSIVVYPSEHADIGSFTAHCLNLDIISDDDSVQGSLDKLLEAIEFHLKSCEAHSADPFCRAPDQYWQFYQKSKRLPTELIERIIKDANARLGVTGLQERLNLEQVEVRELQLQDA